MSGEEKEALKRAVITVLHHGDVIIRPTGSRDGNARRPFRDERTMHLENFCRTIPEDADNWRTGTGELSGRRVHYRMVVKELCTPLYDMRLEHHKVFPALAEACEGASCSCTHLVVRLIRFAYSRTF